MPIYPRGDSFMVSVGSGKNRVRETLPTEELAKAREAFLLAARKQSKTGLQVAESEGVKVVSLGDRSKTLKDCYDIAMRDHWAKSKSLRTTKLNALDVLALIGADTPVTEIDTDAIDELIDKLYDRGISGATINRKTAALSKMLRMALVRRWIPYIPFIPKQTETGRRIVWYTEDEEEEMKAACQRLGLPVLADYIQAAIDTGFRRSEMLKLMVEDCYAGEVRVRDTKNGDPRTIPMTPEVEAIVERAREAGHKRVFEDLTTYNLRTYWDALRDYLGKREDPKYIIHVLRHTTATRLAIGGYSAAQIMAYMGHRAIQTSMGYIHLTGSHLKGAATILKRRKVVPLTLKVANGSGG